MSAVGQAKSRVALAEKKYRKTGAAEAALSVADARRRLAEEKIRQYIERTVAAAPPLTPEQRDRLATLLQGPVSAT